LLVSLEGAIECKSKVLSKQSHNRKSEKKTSPLSKPSYSPYISTSTGKRKITITSILLIITVVSSIVGTYMTTNGFNLQGDDTNPSYTASTSHELTPTPNLINNTTIPPSSLSPMFMNSSIPTPVPTPLSAANGEGEERIVRNTNTPEEKRALTATEDLNATEVFNIAALTVNDYGYPNFINSQVINYYNSNYESAKGITHFSYSANVHTWNQTHAVYMAGTSISVSSPTGIILFPLKEGWGVQIRYVYLNGTRYQEISADKIDFSFSNCYVIEMRLEYSQFLGPTAGIMSKVYQTVIVNEDFMPILICSQSQKAIS
jgi:hypothetical protein